MTAPSSRCAGRDRRAIALFALVAIALLGADLIVKRLAFERLAGAPVALERDEHGSMSIPSVEPRVLVPRLLALRLTVNEGAVFGLGQGGRWVFVAFSVIASIAIVVFFARSGPRDRVQHLALAAVLAGALGNLYDRLRFGVVRDMLHLFPGVRLPFGLRWPGGDAEVYPWIFNVADACLVVGLLALAVLVYARDRRASRPLPEPARRDP